MHWLRDDPRHQIDEHERGTTWIKLNGGHGQKAYPDQVRLRRPDARRGPTFDRPGLYCLTVLLTAAFAAATTWYRQPLNLFGRLEIDGFDVSGVAPLACGMFAFAVATTAGALSGRSIIPPSGAGHSN